MDSDVLSGSGSGGGSGGSGSDFESFYHGVCGDLQSRGEVHSMSKLFATLKSDSERINFILGGNGNGDFHIETRLRCLSQFPVNYAAKDVKDSQKCRNLGNQLYQKNKLAEALEKYSESISAAPHPPPPHSYLFNQDAPNNGNDGTNGNGESYEELSLGYANRSAVLFQLKEYELCIRDITRAFDNSYPNNLMYKLFERKARCLKAMKDFPRAMEAMKNAEMWMKYSTLSETKSSSFKKEIAKQVEFLEEKVAATDIKEYGDQMDQKRGLIAPVKHLPTPQINSEVGLNPEIPCVRADVSLKYATDKGRYLVADKDIQPGIILKGQFTPGIKSVKYIWDMESNNYY